MRLDTMTKPGFSQAHRDHCKIYVVKTSGVGSSKIRCRLIRLKDVKVILKNIHMAHPGFSEQRCPGVLKVEPSEQDHPRRHPSGVWKESVTSWRAPTRRHRLPCRLRDYVLDKTVVHLIEFNDWFYGVQTDAASTPPVEKSSRKGACGGAVNGKSRVGLVKQKIRGRLLIRKRQKGVKESLDCQDVTGIWYKSLLHTPQSSASLTMQETSCDRIVEREHELRTGKENCLETETWRQTEIRDGQKSKKTVCSRQLFQTSDSAQGRGGDPGSNNGLSLPAVLPLQSEKTVSSLKGCRRKGRPRKYASINTQQPAEDDRIPDLSAKLPSKRKKGLQPSDKISGRPVDGRSRKSNSVEQTQSRTTEPAFKKDAHSKHSSRGRPRKLKTDDAFFVNRGQQCNSRASKRPRGRPRKSMQNTQKQYGNPTEFILQSSNACSSNTSSPRKVCRRPRKPRGDAGVCKRGSTREAKGRKQTDRKKHNGIETETEASTSFLTSLLMSENCSRSGYDVAPFIVQPHLPVQEQCSRQNYSGNDGGSSLSTSKEHPQSTMSRSHNITNRVASQAKRRRRKTGNSVTGVSVEARRHVSNGPTRRSKRLQAKEDCRRYKELWCNGGARVSERTTIPDTATLTYSRRGPERSHMHPRNTRNTDSLLQEFVAICPLMSDMPFSDEECLSLLAETPLFAECGPDFAVTTSLRQPHVDINRSEEERQIHNPGPPPRVRRLYGEFLLDEFSVRLLASRRGNPSPKGDEHNSGSDDSSPSHGICSVDGCRVASLFGNASRSSVLKLQELGLDLITRDEGNSCQEITEYDNTGLHPQRTSSMVSLYQSGFAELCPESERGTPTSEQVERQTKESVSQDEILPEEVWLPTYVIHQDDKTILFRPLGEWSSSEEAWRIPKVLWRRPADGAWFVNELLGDTTAAKACFVPEDAWLASWGLCPGDSRVYSVGPPLMQPMPGVLDPVDGGMVDTLKGQSIPNRHHPEEMSCWPIPGISLPATWQQSCQKGRTTSDPSVWYHQLRDSASPSPLIQKAAGVCDASTFGSRPLPDPDVCLQSVSRTAHHLESPSSTVDKSVMLHHEGNLLELQSHGECQDVAIDRWDGLDAMATPLLASNGLQIATSPSTVLPTSLEPAFVSPDAILSHAPDHGPYPLQDVSHHDHQTSGSSSELQQYEAQSTSYDIHVPSTVQEALSMVQDCEDVDSLGQLLFEWCILDVPFRRDWDVVGRMDGKLKRSRPQSAQDFCRFACGFHAASQKAHFTTPFEDQSTIICLGLAAFSRCRDCHDTSEMKLDEDAYCILQMILHLKLPLTEVLASSPGLLPWLPGKPDGLLLRGVLTVLVDFDPITAFSILQGIGWTHLCWEEPGIREVFGQQLSSLVEVLLDCGNYQHCRTALTHLLNHDDERQSCCQLYNSLLSKVLDTCGRCPSAMAIFEDMMDAGLVVNTPTLSKLLTLMWKSPDEEGYEDALCVYHYGLGLGVYPVHTRRGTVWEATVFLGASDAEIFFTLRTLLDQLLDWLVAECGTGGPGPTDDGGVVENGILEERVTDRLSKGHTLEGVMPASGPLDRQLSCHEGIVQSVSIYINLREAPDAVRDCLLSEDEMSIDVFARMLSTKKAIQNSLKEHFQPLTVRLHANGSSDGSSNYAYTLAFNREPLSCWLLDLLD